MRRPVLTRRQPGHSPEDLRAGWWSWAAALPWRRSVASSRYLWPVRLCQDDVTARGLVRDAGVVCLRELRPGDEEEWLRLRLSEAGRLAPWEATCPSQARQDLPTFADYVRQQARRARQGQAMPFVLEVDGMLAGQVSADPIQWGSVRSAQVGYWVASAYEGRGVMRLAVAMAVDHLLGPQVGLHRVEVNVRPGNRRSIALCRALGLREEGLRRAFMHIDGDWADHVSFAVLSEELGGAGMVARLEARAQTRGACDS
ncbi:N-acetyltransferase [Actinomyces lilanjuaniae]|uniref:N-acetyltransferase n=1 Tax=Actinomyces lilanjuaniae TaxID=2321394 RepID=A0ABM6Z6H6_9ACTO|nr:N-acetyltransferase [Actinomyces lilanjuaniae]